MQNKTDLHVHTSFSDGSHTPDECVRKALKNGVTTLAISDHNSFEGVEEAMRFAEGKPIKIVAGIELFTNHPCNFHVLCYFNDANFNGFQPYLYEMNHEKRKNTILKAIKLLKANKIKCKYSKLHRTANKVDRGIYGVFIALSEQNLFDSPYIAQKELFDEGKCCHFENNFTLTEMITNLHKFGGKVFIAHPISYNLPIDLFKRFMPELIESGIDGLEKYHCTSDDDKIQEIDALCQKYNLLFSGGSDYHGPSRKKAEIGYYFNHTPLPEDLFTNIFPE